MGGTAAAPATKQVTTVECISASFAILLFGLNVLRALLSPGMWLTIFGLCLATSASTSLIFYNRIPKTGSTSLCTVLKRAAGRQGHIAYHGNTLNRNFSLYWNRLLTDDGNRLIQRRLCRHVAGLRRPGIFALHVPYLNFTTACNGTPPTYINMVRDPVARHLSSNRFTQTCVCGTERKRWCADARYRIRAGRPGSYERYCKATDAELVEAQLRAQPPGPWPQPTLNTPNVLTHWFCGMGESAAEDSLCNAAIQSPKAVRRAKATMRRGFAWIGVLEEPALSHAALIRRFPDLFSYRRARTLLNITRVVHPGDVHNGSNPDVVLAAATAARLRAMLRNDYVVYEYALRLLSLNQS